MNGSKTREEQALARVLAEAKAELLPEQDWTRLEGRLAELPAPVSTPSQGFARVALGLAAAAAVLLAVFWPFDPKRPEPLPEQRPPVETRAKSGDELAPGTRLSADHGDVVVEHRGRSRFTLLQGGIATVTSREGLVTLGLERGSVVVEVVPSARAESFVVEVASTRVAVHGTRFRVTLSSDGVEVNVTEGTVLVGPRSEPGTGTALSAPAGSRFTLGGAPWIGGAKDPAPPVRPHGERSTTMPSAAAAPSTPPSSEPPGVEEKPGSAAIDTVIADVVALASTCFRQHTTAGEGVRVSAATQATLRALPSGAIELVSFEPPLAPPVHACVQARAAGLRVAETRTGATVSRRIELER